MNSRENDWFRRWASYGIVLVFLFFSLTLTTVTPIARCQKNSNTTDTPPSAPLLSTGVTGSIGNSSGLDDPQYVLSFVSVQRLMLDAVQHPLTKTEIDKAVAGTPVSLKDLLRLELLRQDRETYRLNYLLLTVQDQQTMYRVAAQYGQGLADAFRARAPEFKEILDRYPSAELRRQLAFALVAGAALNWGGLDLTTELGYRVQQPRHANGDAYLCIQQKTERSWILGGCIGTARLSLVRR